MSHRALVNLSKVFSINPPILGSFVDERGIQRPQAIMPYRINGQYILEGLVASFMFSLTGNFCSVRSFFIRRV
jgi:hypothetical protein